MSFKFAACAFVPLLALLSIAGCRQQTSNTNGGAQPQTQNKRDAGPLSEGGFKAIITLVDPPARLRAGEKASIQVRAKNASDVQWFARGGEINMFPDNRYYLAVGNRWLKAEGEQLLTNMDGRYGLDRDLKPGEETQVPLLITAPKELGEYILEIDLVQEQVAWFHDKGSPTAKTKVSVVR
jgi:hypothetical protein